MSYQRQILVLRESGLFDLFEGEHANGYYLLGDSGYPAKRWLLTAYLSPQNATEEGYNRVIVACCVLHNICKERAISINGDDDSDDEDDNADNQLAQGVQQPPNVAENSFRDHFYPILSYIGNTLPGGFEQGCPTSLLVQPLFWGAVNPH
ncbi:hypothetical protein MAR_017732 [Mya arenaria]|uniref:DDE Tnp4 domain-containing protein n=1 Tax=Mya arenaria TaxID=6604 RepID=A0ABY7EHA3_MYAAR|nr:hypothetical protein MAR_017732 [Mya arenaria]